MLKKRLIFVLYFDSGFFYLSRNFRLQRVGDVKWLMEKFRFKTIGSFVDEIVILDVTRNSAIERCNGEQFNNAINTLMRETFVPLTIGGGLKTIEDASRCFNLGADKVLFNTAIITSPKLVKDCVDRFGAQAIVGAIDVVKDELNYFTKIVNAQEKGIALDEHLKKLSSLGVGELMINSIEKDGTGTGFDLEMAARCQGLNIPVIICGGAGKPEHFAEALSSPLVEAAATGHLFNFVGKGFEAARMYLSENGFPVRSI